MAITVTLPISAPTNLTSTPVAGGSLLANTTYYYIIIAYSETAYSASPFYHSPISIEASFTTDAINKSVKINWSNIPEHTAATRYQILMTTASGDYTNSGGYGTAAENVGTINSGVVGYTITALSTEIYVIHSIQLRNSFVGDINRSLGIIKISLTGTGAYDLKNIYDAIVASGFSSYAYFDEYNFYLKGWIVSEGTVTGNLTVYAKRLVFIKGGLVGLNPNFIMQFGGWLDNLRGADNGKNCSIDIQNSRDAIRTPYTNAIKIYGGMVTACHSQKTSLVENKSTGYYTNTKGGGNGQLCIGNQINEWKEVMLDIPLRSVQSDTKDLKVSAWNNWSNLNNVRLKVLNDTALPYYGGGKFYACEFTVAVNNPMYVPGGTPPIYYTDFYDCNWLSTQAWRYWTNYGNVKSDNYTQYNYSLNFKVTDNNGVSIDSANISIKDKENNAATWIQHDTTLDKLVTGTINNTDKLTNSNGLIDTYYIKSYKVNLAPDNTIASAACTNIVKTIYYPFSIRISKVGYETQTIILETLLKKTDLIIALKPIVSIRKDIEGNLYKALTPETGSSSRLLEL